MACNSRRVKNSNGLFRDLTGVSIGSERMYTLTNQAAEGLTMLDVAPSREEIERRGAQVVVGQWRRPVVVLGIGGAYAPTRPASARGRRLGQGQHRAKRPRWTGQWREVKGFRFYLIDGDHIGPLLSWHQVQTEAQVSPATGQRGRSVCASSTAATGTVRMAERS